MTLYRRIFVSAAVLSTLVPLSWASAHSKPAGHRHVVSIPAEGLDVSEMMLMANKSHTLLFLNLPKQELVQMVEVTDSSRPVALNTFWYGAREGVESFHLIEHLPSLLNAAAAGRDSIDHSHTISLVDLSGKLDRHGVASIKGMCDYITDPHRAVTYVLCEHTLTVIRTSDEDDAGKKLWESTLSP